MKELLLRPQKKGIPVEKLIPAKGTEVLQITKADRMVRVVHEKRHPLIIRQVVLGLLHLRIVLHPVQVRQDLEVQEAVLRVAQEADLAAQAVLEAGLAVLIVEEDNYYNI